MENIRESMVWQLCSYAVSALLCFIFFGTVAFFLALVGVTIGTLIGTLIGLKSDRTVVVHKAAIGAVAGGVLSIEVFRVSLSFFRPVTTGFNWFFPLFDSAKYRLARKLVPDWYEPAAANNADIIRKPPLAELKKIPSMKMTKKCLLDSSGNRLCCSICLQDLECRQVVRRVPCCHQTFHPRCINKWLVRHDSCPLCRRKVLNG